MRIAWQDRGDRLDASVRRAGAALGLSMKRLQPVGVGAGPHGPLSWRAGRATLDLDGEEIHGVGVVERLRGDVAVPSFGRFEMWLLASPSGSLVLGRRTLDGGDPGHALRVDRVGRPSTGPFDVEVIALRRHEPTGFELPIAWTLPSDANLSFSRSGRDTSVTGLGAAGGPVVFDIGLAASSNPRAAALVFHLQDSQPSPD